MANLPGVVSFPGGWEFLGEETVAVSTSTSIQTAVEALGVADGDRIRIRYIGVNMGIGDSWANFPVEGATTNGLSEWQGFWPNAPLTFTAKTAPATLYLAVFRWQASP